VEDILRRLGKRIREIRIQRGFGSQEEFADYCKMHRTFLGHLETGRKDFRLTTVIRVAGALGVTLEELFAGLEIGEPRKLERRNPGPDSHGMLRELATLQRSVEKLKDLASPRPRRVPAMKQARKQARKPKKAG
jgi:transcriptional regulator with XRE-family HTH domain